MNLSKKWLVCGICTSILVQNVSGVQTVFANEFGKSETTSLVNPADKLVDTNRSNQLKKAVTKVIPGRGDAEKEVVRMRNSLKLSNLSPTGLYAKANDRITINYQGNKTNLKLRIGIEGMGQNDRDIEQTFPITKGINQIISKYEGAIFIINPNDEGSENLIFNGMTGEMPYFELGKTSDAEFAEQMKTMTQAKDVQLVSDRAMVTLRYAQVKKHLKISPRELMINFEQMIRAQDEVSGISPKYQKEHQPTKLLHHYIDTYKANAYMDATHYRMRFGAVNDNGIAVANLLSTDHDKRWGIWHETGHQRQQSVMKWNSLTEVAVNIYSLAAERELTGGWNRIKPYYKKIREYMNKPIQQRDYEKIDHFERLMIFAQLWETFGDDFYPVIHQLYRESTDKDLDQWQRRQLLIVRVSETVGLNMVRYFEEWGIPVEPATRKQLAYLPKLDQPIWKNDDQQMIKLPVKLIDNVTLKQNQPVVNLVHYDAKPYKGYKLVMEKDNQTIATLTYGLPQNSTLDKNIWKINKTVNSTDQIKIKAVDQLGNETIIYPQDIQAPEIDKTPPTTPEGLLAPEVNITNSSISLVWKASIDDVEVSHYNVYRNNVKIGQTTTPGYIDTGLLSGTTYSYQVSAVDTAGNESIKTKALKATTKGEITIPPLPEAPNWDSNKTYLNGDLVSYRQGVFKAKWWNKGSNPEESDAWQLVSGQQNWSAKKAYQRAERVTHKDSEYEAQQWTQNQEPGKSNNWKKLN